MDEEEIEYYLLHGALIAVLRRYAARKDLASIIQVARNLGQTIGEFAKLLSKEEGVDVLSAINEAMRDAKN